jgi:hypothetical protein
MPLVRGKMKKMKQKYMAGEGTESTASPLDVVV